MGAAGVGPLMLHVLKRQRGEWENAKTAEKKCGGNHRLRRISPIKKIKSVQSASSVVSAAFSAFSASFPSSA
jgi:hypothetical protein